MVVVQNLCWAAIGEFSVGYIASSCKVPSHFLFSYLALAEMSCAGLFLLLTLFASNHLKSGILGIHIFFAFLYVRVHFSSRKFFKSFALMPVMATIALVGFIFMCMLFLQLKQNVSSLLLVSVY